VQVMNSSCALVVWLLLASVATMHAQSGVVAGRVVDARTDQPLAGVLVRVEQQGVFAETDANGQFRVTLPPGTHTLVASLIGYAVLRHTLELSANTSPEIVLVLSEGAGAYAELVTVGGAMHDDAERVPGGAVLHGRDLQALRGVMLDDPLRAVQALPAATATDDFYSEFAVRGSPFRHMGLAIDGIPAPHLIHSIHTVTDGGSIAMINSEALGAVSLLPASYPQRLGRRLGAQLDLTTRDGNREGFRGRAGLSGTSAHVTAEGPVANGRGGWLASVRKSYLDFLLDRIDPEGSFGFGFTDALGKFSFDLNPRHQLQLLSVVGRSVFDEGPEDLGANDAALAVSHGWLAAATWRFTPTARLAMSHRVYATGMDFRNVNKSGALLDRGNAHDLGWRTDIDVALRGGWRAAIGGDVVKSGAGNARQRTFDDASSPVIVDDYTAAGRAASAYAQVSARVGRVTLTPGGRIDYWQATRTATSSPWIAGELALAPGTRLLGGAGVYRQLPALTMLRGINGNADLDPERATHVDVGVVQSVANSVHLQVTAFWRDEQDVLRVVGAEPRRLADGTIEVGRGDARWQNRLSGRARGVETVVRRDAPDGLSGWIAYGYARHRYHDELADERFWSDHDQRHTFSAYGLYRLSHRTTVGAKFRYGSNYPITGYVAEQTMPNARPLLGGQRPLFFGLTDARNTLRLPAYARLDVRVDRAVSWSGQRVTLFAEVANLLNRRNERNVQYSVDRNGRVSGVTDSLLPIVPSAGLVIEF
jgi:hypothetical protein